VLDPFIYVCRVVWILLQFVRFPLADMAIMEDAIGGVMM
jgi:hypothetical protein